MRTAFLMGILMAAAGCGKEATEADTAWAPSFPLAMESAAQQDKDIVIFFHAAWCGICRHMSTSVFYEDAVKEVLRDYVPVKVDIDEEKYLAEKYRVAAVPTVLVLNAKGEERFRAIGGLDAGQMVRLLEHAPGSAGEQDEP